MDLMLDTNVFNRVRDGYLPIQTLSGHGLFATYIQSDEISATPNPEHCEELRRVFTSLAPGSQTVIAVPGYAIPGLVVPGGGSDSLLDKIRDRLDATKRSRNNMKDALIAESAARHGLTLVTDDRALLLVATEFGIPCIDSQTLLHQGQS